jgi:ankyrin repeat protein
MVEASPQSLKMADRQGNLPLHYAVMYSSEAVVELLADLSPDACQHANAKARLPLHLLCARHWDQDSLSLALIRTILRHNTGAVRKQERQGRLPLHLACEQGHPRRDIVELLVESFPAGLLCAETQSGRTPLTTYAFMTASGSHDNEILLKILGDKTKLEKSKNGLIIRLMFRTRTI